MPALRVLVADDEVLLRAGIARLLERAGMEVVAEAGDARQAVQAVVDHEPDVAICDVQMPPEGTDDGLRLAIAIRREHPKTSVVVLTQFVEERYSRELIGDDAEGDGYLHK